MLPWVFAFKPGFKSYVKGCGAKFGVGGVEGEGGPAERPGISL